MGFVSQLVTLIWLIVEQRAGGTAGSNRAGALQGAGQCWDELGMPQGCAWQPHPTL